MNLARNLILWMPVPHSKTSACREHETARRLFPMLSAQTLWLVGRLHVDLGRARNMMCR
ncbi:hypothetical protein AERO9AM_11154 [Aeromicrobium sp. 9AM]|nr:hypothetical protein AERO9AM_11154 [Aeromicrobium sp. 9AM]